jgi:ribose/xylose/arabinose/galactoside ABC-type transport system permease subunit
VTSATATPDGPAPPHGSTASPGDDATRVATRRARTAAMLQRSGAFLILLVVTVLASLVFGTRFASVDNFLNILEASSFLGLIAVAMTFVIIGGGIDLSVGSLLALSAVLAAYGSQYGSVAAVALPMVVCGLIGLFNGLLIARARMAAFIVTLAALLFARGLAFAVSDEGNTIFHIDSELAVIWLGQGSIAGIRVPIITAAIAFVVGWVVLTRTRYGMAVTAIGGSEDAARLMGLPIVRVKTALYLASGLLAGLAGLLVAARSSSGQSTIGVGLELQAIAAVVIGGTLLTGGSGSMMGTLAGVLLLNVINNVINQVGTLSSYYQQVVSGVFLIVVVLIQRYLSREQRQ